MTESEKKEIKKIIEDQIDSVREEIEELKELTKPVKLDASVGRLSRMDAINNKAINDKQLREKKSTLQKLERALKCGNEIPFGRLKFMPYTTRCVQCAGR